VRRSLRGSKTIQNLSMPVLYDKSTLQNLVLTTSLVLLLFSYLYLTTTVISQKMEAIFNKI